MWLASKPLSERQRRQGFTIVELLIVIVVIGILAAITIVTYTGIQQRAQLAVLESDLSNASDQLGSDNAVNGSYPATAALSNNGQGLKTSPGTTFAYTYTGSTNSFCLTGTNNGVTYYVSSTTTVPTAGSCPLTVGVTTLAGSGSSGFADGSGTSAQFSGPRGVAVDTSGNIYVADSSNNRIRKISSSGVVTTLAGSGTAGYLDGAGTAAKFSNPEGVAVDSSGNVYVADYSNNRVRKITSAGVVTTLAGSGNNGFADGTGTAAQFNDPNGVAVDPSGNVYIADMLNNRIRKITAAGVVTTLAGSGTAGFLNGIGTAAQFNYPTGVAVDSSGNVYVGDYNNSAIRKITSAGVVTTLAGSGSYGYADGTGTAAQFNGPSDVAVDSTGNVYVADFGNSRIREVTSSGVVTTLAGSGTVGYSDGSGTAAQFYYPVGVAVDSSGNLYIGDTYNYRIRKITQS